MAKQILLIQPESPSNQVLIRYFAEKGYQVKQVPGPAHGAAELQQYEPYLVVLDLHYPGEDWLKFLKLARQTHPGLKIICTNKFPDLQREMLARENGVAAFLRQPYTEHWIEQALAQAFSNAVIEQPTNPKPMRLPKVRFPIRIKITLPYLLLTLIFALSGAYLISQLVVESIQQRFLSQLVSSGTQTADWMVREEDRLLENLRLMVYTEGTAAAMQNRDANTLFQLLLPVAVNANLEAVEVLDPAGTSLLSMRLKPGSTSDYEIASGDTTFQNQDFVLKTLLGQIDEYGNKFAGLVNADGTTRFYISAPVVAADGSRVGALLVGEPISVIARLASQETLAQVTIYDSAGSPLASSLFSAGNEVPIQPDQTAVVLGQQKEASYTRDLTANSIAYSEILGPWEVRGGVDFGVIGTALPQSYYAAASSGTQLQIFGLVALGIFLVIGMGLLLSGRITRPIVDLAEASTRVAEGNLEVKVDSKGDDEVAILSYAFNYMIAGLQEGSVYRDLLGRTVSPEVRDQLHQNFTSGSLKLEGQEAVATVLMTDIRGFTSMSEQVDPATVLAWLNEYFGRLVPIVTEHGGVVNKFDGDAMLAFFGILPKRQSPRQGAGSACQAALEMLEAVETLNQQRIKRGEPALVTGIGVHTGEVIAGGLGTSDRLHYTIIGDTVNTTQRVEALTREMCEGNGALISSSTCWALAKDLGLFKLQGAGFHAVKGKSEMVEIYRLLGRNPNHKA